MQRQFAALHLLRPHHLQTLVWLLWLLAVILILYIGDESSSFERYLASTPSHDSYESNSLDAKPADLDARKHPKDECEAKIPRSLQANLNYVSPRRECPISPATNSISHNTAPQHKPRVAVLLYGLFSRSLMYTHTSIKRNVIAALEDDGFAVDLFAHSLLVPYIHNPRAKEVCVPLDPTNTFYLNYTTLVTEDQRGLDSLLSYETFEKYGSAWKDEGDEFDSLHNLLRQLHSLQRSWHLMNDYAAHCRISYHAVVLLRPDCYYESKVRIKHLQFPDNVVYVPTVDPPIRETHDRFSIASVKAAYVIAHRKESARAYCLARGVERPLHSEKLLDYHLREHHISTRLYDIRFCRIRANANYKPDTCDNFADIKREMMIAASQVPMYLPK